MNSRKFYRTVLVVEILSEDSPFDSHNLADVHDAITDGDCSGMVKTVAIEECDEARIGDLLTAQGSDLEFFGLEERS